MKLTWDTLFGSTLYCHINVMQFRFWKTPGDGIATFHYASQAGHMTLHSSSLLSTQRFWPFHQRYLWPRESQNQNYMPKCTHKHKQTKRGDRHVDMKSAGEVQCRTVQTSRDKHAHTDRLKQINSTKWPTRQYSMFHVNIYEEMWAFRIRGTSYLSWADWVHILS